MRDVSKRWPDLLTVVVGVLLFITPLVFRTTGITAAAWTAYVGGVLLIVAGVWNLTSGTYQLAIEWAVVVIGVLLFIAPWALGFSGVTTMAWSAWIAGVLAVLIGGSVLLRERNRPMLAGQH